VPTKLKGFLKLSTLPFDVLDRVAVGCRQDSLELSDIDVAVSILVELIEQVLQVLLGDHLVVGVGCSHELVEVHIAVTVEIQLLEDIVPLVMHEA